MSLQISQTLPGKWLVTCTEQCRELRILHHDLCVAMASSNTNRSMSMTVSTLIAGEKRPKVVVELR